MKGLDLSAKKITFGDFIVFEFDRKIAKLKKIRVFERNLTLNFSSVRKFHMSKLGLNTKKLLSTILEISI